MYFLNCLGLVLLGLVLQKRSLLTKVKYVTAWRPGGKKIQHTFKSLAKLLEKTPLICNM